MPAIPESLSPSIQSLGSSPTLQINELTAQMEREGRHVFRFGLGESPFPVPAAAVKSLEKHASANAYLPVAGEATLRKAVADFHIRRYNIEADPDLVMIGPGSKQLMFLLQLCLNGDVILPTPCWVSYAPQAAIAGLKTTLIHTAYEEKWRLTPEKLDEQLSGKSPQAQLLILNFPGNPDGLTYSSDELKALAEVCRRHGVIVLSDEIYAELHHAGEHVSMARHYPEGTIIASGLSKWCGAGGWRLGTFIFPPVLKWLLKAMCKVASQSHSTVAAPIQFAAAEAYSASDEIEDYLLHCRRILKPLGNWCAETLSAAGVSVHKPTGAFYLYPDFSPFREVLKARGVTTSKQMCELLLEETGVAILTGEAFCRPEDDLTARLAYVNFDGTAVLRASRDVPLEQELDEQFFLQHTSDTLKGVAAIAEWCQDLA